MLRHRLLVALLALGAIGGFTAGFASVHRHHHHACGAGHEASAAAEDGR